MSKRRKRRQRRLHTRGDEILGGIGGFLVGYMLAEAVLQRYMHPLHWVAAGVIGVLTYLSIWLWYYWRRALREEQAEQER